MDSIHKVVQERTKRRCNKEKESYDRKVKLIPIKEGDKVYEKEQVRPDKLTPRWKVDPVKVVKRCKSPRGTPGHTYIVQRSDGSKHRRNTEQLKPARADLEDNVTKNSAPLPSKEKIVPMLWDSDHDDSTPTGPTTRSATAMTMPPSTQSSTSLLPPPPPEGEEANWVLGQESPLTITSGKTSNMGIGSGTIVPPDAAHTRLSHNVQQTVTLPTPPRDIAKAPACAPSPIRERRELTEVLSVRRQAASRGSGTDPTPRTPRRNSMINQTTSTPVATVGQMGSSSGWNAIGTNLFKGQSKGSSKGKGKRPKPKGLGEVAVNLDFDPECEVGEERSEGERATNRSIFNFAQFLRHNAVVGTRKAAALRPPVLTLQGTEEPLHDAADATEERRDELPVSGDVATEAASVTAHGNRNQPPYQPLSSEAGANSSPESYASQDGYSTPDETSNQGRVQGTSPDQEPEASAPATEIAEGANEIVVEIVRPKYNLRSRHGKETRQEETRERVHGHKRNNESMEPPVASGQAAKFILQDRHATVWSTRPRLNFAQGGRNEITFAPYSSRDTEETRGSAYRASPSEQREGRKRILSDSDLDLAQFLEREVGNRWPALAEDEELMELSLSLLENM